MNWACPNCPYLKSHSKEKLVRMAVNLNSVNKISKVPRCIHVHALVTIALHKHISTLEDHWYVIHYRRRCLRTINLEKSVL